VLQVARLGVELASRPAGEHPASKGLVHRALPPSGSLWNIDSNQYSNISTVVNIEVHRYADGMATTKATSTDPDIRLLSALADPTRLAILRELAAGPETCACDFTATCDVGQPTVSHHLRVLREAGLVSSERRGNWIFYRIAPDAADRLAGVARTLVPGGLISPSDLVATRRSARLAAAEGG
jgi:ArsR family transcriptional regulator